jgi:hypothetical protein
MSVLSLEVIDWTAAPYQSCLKEQFHGMVKNVRADVASPDLRG